MGRIACQQDLAISVGKTYVYPPFLQLSSLHCLRTPTLVSGGFVMSQNLLL